MNLFIIGFLFAGALIFACAICTFDKKKDGKDGDTN